MVKNVTYGQLRNVLLSLGCEPVPSQKDHFVFDHPRSDLLIILQEGADDQLVRPIDLFSDAEVALGSWLD